MITVQLDRIFPTVSSSKKGKYLLPVWRFVCLFLLESPLWDFYQSLEQCNQKIDVASEKYYK